MLYKHWTDVEDHGSESRASCRCGWAGELRPDHDSAIRDGQQHKSAAVTETCPAGDPPRAEAQPDSPDWWDDPPELSEPETMPWGEWTDPGWEPLPHREPSGCACGECTYCQHSQAQARARREGRSLPRSRYCKCGICRFCDPELWAVSDAVEEPF